MPTSFGGLIRHRMEELNIPTQRRLAELMAESCAPVHENMVSRWVNDQSRPTGGRLAALLDVLQLKRREDRAEACLLACLPPEGAQGDQARSDSDAA